MKMILGKDEVKWSQIWQNLHKNKINYNVQSTIWQQITKTYITGYDLGIWGLLEESPCKLCGLEQESQHHLMEYLTALYVWGYSMKHLKRL